MNSFTTNIRRRCELQRGFTALELMLTLMIVTILGTMITTSYQSYRSRVQSAQAVADITALQGTIDHYALDNQKLPTKLDDLGPGYVNLRDPWGSPYQYVNHAAAASGSAKIRNDKNGVLINSDFDLYSSGPDRDSQSGLNASASRDDIVRASNGRFVGPASSYEP